MTKPNRKIENSIIATPYFLANCLILAIVLLVSTCQSSRVRSQERNDALLEAVESENIQMLETAINSGANVDVTNKTWATALMIASEKGNSAIVQRLIEAKANINLMDEKGTTALMRAAYRGSSGHLETMNMLIRAGARLDNKDRDGSTALINAVVGRNSSGLEILLKAQAEINIRDKAGNTPLINAIKDGFNEEIVRLLLQYGAELNARNDHGASAIIIAAEYCNSHHVSTLAAAGANPNLKTNTGRTALMSLVAKNHSSSHKTCAAYEDSVRAVIEKGADVNARDNYGVTPLMLHTWAGGSSEIRDLLLSNGALRSDIEQNENLIKAIKAGDSAKVSAALKAGASASTLSSPENEQTVLMLAVEENRIDIVRLLTKNGADLDATRGKGETALTLATLRNYTEIAQILIHSGANVNIKPSGHYSNSAGFITSHGFLNWTALMNASSHGNAILVSDLLEAGADANREDVDGLTALNIAAKNGHTQVMKILRSKGGNAAIGLPTVKSSR